jgi:hypothetical protein
VEVSRRNFLKASGAGLGSLFLFGALNDDAIMARIRQSFSVWCTE